MEPCLGHEAGNDLEGRIDLIDEDLTLQAGNRRAGFSLDPPMN